MKDKTIARIMLELGCSISYQGFNYLHDMIGLVHEDNNVIHNLKRNAYPVVSEKYSTTKDSIERDMRTLISSTWNDNPEPIRKMSKKKLVCAPSIKEFIAIIIAYMKYYRD